MKVLEFDTNRTYDMVSLAMLFTVALALCTMWWI